MDENKKNESAQNQENPKSNGSENPIQSNNDINLSQPKEKMELNVEEKNKNLEEKKRTGIFNIKRNRLHSGYKK